MSNDNDKITTPDPKLPLSSGSRRPDNQLLAGIWHASANGDLAKLKALLSRKSVDDAIESTDAPVNFDQFNQKCRPHAFKAAVQQEQIEVLSFLYDEGYRATSGDLREVAKSNNVEIVRLCLNRGADLSDPGILRYSWDSEDVLDMLLQAGVDPNKGLVDRRDRSLGTFFYFQPSRRDLTPLESAAYEASLMTIKKLIQHGANPKLGNVLHYAACRGQSHPRAAETPAVIEYLVSIGCDPNEHDDHGHHKTRGRPLHWAMEVHNSVEVVRALIRNGANPASRSVLGGGTPLDWAIGDGRATDELCEALNHERGGDSITSGEQYLYAQHWYEPVTWPKGGYADLKKHWQSQ